MLLLRNVQAPSEKIWLVIAFQRSALKKILAESLQHDNVHSLKQKLSPPSTGWSLLWCFLGGPEAGSWPPTEAAFVILT